MRQAVWETGLAENPRVAIKAASLARSWTISIEVRAEQLSKVRVMEQKTEGPPKRKDRKVIGAMIGAATGFVLLLIAFAFFSDFPGGSHEGMQNAEPPPEDVSRARP